eukprot:1261071-Amorphochlora_amoeboformis.AAC.2
MATLPPRRNLGVFCCFHWIILMTLLAERTPFLALQIKRGVGKRGGYNIARGLGLFSRGGSVKVGSSKLRRPGIGFWGWVYSVYSFILALVMTMLSQAYMHNNMRKTHTMYTYICIDT